MCVLLIRLVESGVMLVARYLQTKPACTQMSANNLIISQQCDSDIRPFGSSLRNRVPLSSLPLSPPALIHCSLSSAHQTQWSADLGAVRASQAQRVGRGAGRREAHLPGLTHLRGPLAFWKT